MATKFATTEETGRRTGVRSFETVLPCFDDEVITVDGTPYRMDFRQTQVLEGHQTVSLEPTSRAEAAINVQRVAS